MPVELSVTSMFMTGLEVLGNGLVKKGGAQSGAGCRVGV